MMQPADDDQHVLANLAAAVDQAAGLLEWLVAVQDVRETAEALQRAAVDEARETRRSGSQIAEGPRVSMRLVQREYSPKPDPLDGPEPIEGSGT